MLTFSTACTATCIIVFWGFINIAFTVTSGEGSVQSYIRHKPSRQWKQLIHQLSRKRPKDVASYMKSLIQSDGPKCRDDLCISKLIHEYSDLVELDSNFQPNKSRDSFACPHGYRKVYRETASFCEPFGKPAKTKTKPNKPRQNKKRLTNKKKDRTRWNKNRNHKNKTPAVQELPSCEHGKVAAMTADGYTCMEPVFPASVCPPDKVPHLSMQGLIACVPCPPGQMAARVRDGVTCVVMTTTPTLTTEKPCPEGLVALMTYVGRVCQYVPPAQHQEAPYCPEGQVARLERGSVVCVTRDPCPSGQVHITLDTGKEVCGFNTNRQPSKCSTGERFLNGRCISSSFGRNQDFATNLIPNEPTIERFDLAPEVPHNHHCVTGSILTQTQTGFQCQPVKLPTAGRPVCDSDHVFARLGDYFECIPEYIVSLECKESEVLTRSASGFECKTEDMLPDNTECSGGKVSSIDEQGRKACVTLDTASVQCGDGYTAVRDGDTFICKAHHVDFSCPQGFTLSLDGGIPTCVYSAGPECLNAINQGQPCISPDLKDSNPTPCGEGYIFDKANTGHGCVLTVENYPDIPNDTGLKDPPCSASIDGFVRPCDLDIELLLAGCNPDCANGGTCNNGKCTCPAGVTGSACQHDIDECGHHGHDVCEYRCENVFGSYQCTCPSGTTLNTDGRTCQDMGCHPDCLNGGQCVRGVCQCQSGFHGRYCETDNDECMMHGKRLCEHICRNTYGGYQCVCPPGSRLNQDQRTCTNTTCIPECKNGGKCDNHKCYCPRGFYGIICQLDVNECYKQRPCQHTCHNTRGSYTCSCNHGYTLYSDKHTCHRVQ